MVESVVPEEQVVNAPLVTSFLRNNPCLAWIMQDWRVGPSNSIVPSLSIEEFRVDSWDKCAGTVPAGAPMPRFRALELL